MKELSGKRASGISLASSCEAVSLAKENVVKKSLIGQKVKAGVTSPPAQVISRSNQPPGSPPAVIELIRALEDPP